MIKRSKMSIYIKQVNSFRLFWLISNNFDIKLIYFDWFYLFNIFGTDFNQFRHDDYKSSYKFGLKKLIKSRFDHDLSWNLSLSWLHCISLAFSNIYSIWVILVFNWIKGMSPSTNIEWKKL